MASRLAEGATSHAVLFGASWYADENLHDLPGVSNNLADMYALLRSERSWALPAENCHLLPNPALRIVGRQITQSASLAEDTLLVYYAGHGLPGKHGKLFLTLPDTEDELREYTALDFALIRSAMANSPARNRVLILDCCFSGRAVETMADMASIIAVETEIRGTYTVTSSAANVPAVAPPGARHTSFTGALLELVETGVPGGPEVLSLQDLFGPLYTRQFRAGMPLPKQHGTDQVHHLALVRNMAVAQVEAPDARRPAAHRTAEGAAQPRTESEQKLDAFIEGLREFERDTRVRINSYLRSQVTALTAQPDVTDQVVAEFAEEYYTRLRAFYVNCQGHLNRAQPPSVFVLDRASREAPRLQAFATEYHSRLQSWMASLSARLEMLPPTTQEFSSTPQLRTLVEGHLREELERL